MKNKATDFLDFAREVRESIEKDELGKEIKVMLPLVDGIIKTIENINHEQSKAYSDDNMHLMNEERIILTPKKTCSPPVEYKVVVSGEEVVLINMSTFGVFGGKAFTRGLTRGELRKMCDPMFSVSFTNTK